jgi:hypothetical protein
MCPIQKPNPGDSKRKGSASSLLLAEEPRLPRSGMRPDPGFEPGYAPPQLPAVGGGDFFHGGMGSRGPMPPGLTGRVGVLRLW